jgi:hypothetical protein
VPPNASAWACRSSQTPVEVEQRKYKGYLVLSHYVPLSERICTHMFRIVPSSLTDMWAPHVSFFLNLQSSRGSPWARPPLRPWRRSRGATSAAGDLPRAKWPAGDILWCAGAASSPLPSPSCGASIARVKIRSNPGRFGRVLVRLAASSPSPAPHASGSRREVQRSSGWSAVPTASCPLCRPPGPPRTRRRRGRQGGRLLRGGRPAAMERGASPRRSPAEEGAAATRAPPHPRTASR